jgi:hypothetical protein
MSNDCGDATAISGHGPIAKLKMTSHRPMIYPLLKKSGRRIWHTLRRTSTATAKFGANKRSIGISGWCKSLGDGTVSCYFTMKKFNGTTNKDAT